MAVAFCTFSTSSCFAEPNVEYESKATLALASMNSSNDAALVPAITANSSAVGFWLSAQSANKKIPS